MSTLMVLGTTSDAGKSTLVAGLCRLFARCGHSVVPFKPQNMALNSAVTCDGGEIGRAQALQAQACFLSPHTDMNPVLLKPSSDTQAQVIIHGHPLKDMDAIGFHNYKTVAMNAVLQSYTRLQQRYATIFVEGAGSPAEINLRAGDIANMGFAEEVDCPCILIADIDKGGVFAHIVGTLELLSASERNRIVGFVINRFRGDIRLLESGLEWLEAYTQKPVLGVLPYLKHFYLDAEDAINTHQVNKAENVIRIVVPVMPRISNHTDFDVFRRHPHVELIYVGIEQAPPSCDVIILPGSKNVRADLAHLKKHGWAAALQRHLRYGGKVFGVCGGYQMLGRKISDPQGVEDQQGESLGFGFIPMDTTFLQQKYLQKIQTNMHLAGLSAAVNGYEIHHGVSRFYEDVQPLLRDADGVEEGYINPDSTIAGSYCHGIFDTAESCSALLRWCGLNVGAEVSSFDQQEQQLNRLADVLKENIAFQKLNRSLVQHGFATSVLEAPFV